MRWSDTANSSSMVTHLGMPSSRCVTGHLLNSEMIQVWRPKRIRKTRHLRSTWSLCKTSSKHVELIEKTLHTQRLAVAPHSNNSCEHYQPRQVTAAGVWHLFSDMSEKACEETAHRWFAKKYMWVYSLLEQNMNFDEFWSVFISICDVFFMVEEINSWWINRPSNK